MFAWSEHVESIVLLSKLKSNKLKHINVELEMDELDLMAAESKAIYAEVKDYVFFFFPAKKQGRCSLCT